MYTKPDIEVNKNENVLNGLKPIEISVGQFFAIVAFICFCMHIASLIAVFFYAKENQFQNELVLSFFGNIALLAGLSPLRYWDAPAVHEQILFEGKNQFKMLNFWGIVKDILIVFAIFFVIQWAWELILGALITVLGWISQDFRGLSLNVLFAEQETVRILRDHVTENRHLLGLFFLEKAVLTPIAEELLFRYFLYRSVKRYFSVKTACISVAFLFALCHWNVRAFLGLFAVGILLTRLYEKYKNLWVSVVTHGLFNALSISWILLRIFWE